MSSNDARRCGRPPWRIERGSSCLADDIGLLSFDAVLREVEAFLREAPLDADELEEIQGARESYAAMARDWLDQRRLQLTSLDERDLEALGLGSRVLASGLEVSLSELSTVAFSGSA